MPEPQVGQRLVAEAAPDERALRDWLGSPAYATWSKLTASIEEAYPGVFQPDWTFGGRKHGWALRFKKSKSFCTLVPEYRRFSVQMVFGAAEREKVEAMLPELPGRLRQLYAEAPTFHDGKWTLFGIPDDADLPGIMQLLTAKRRPRTGA